MIKQRTWMRINIACLTITLLLGQSLTGGQRLTFGQEASGAGAVELAEYQSYIPLLIRQVFVESTGELDPSFDEDGILTTDFGIWDQAEDVALQPDGKVVAAGTTYNDERECFALARYQPDGSLDETFGSGGKVITDFGVFAYGFAVALQTDGKILVAGYILDYRNPDDPEEDIALTRYTPEGSLDTSFGVGGMVTTDFYSGFDEAYDLLLLPDGKILLAGSADNGTTYDFVLVRYSPDGSLDTGFDGDGMLTTDFDGYWDVARAVARQPDGKLVVVGEVTGENLTCINSCLALARYNPDGSLDMSLDGDGMLVMEEMYYPAHDIALQPDGKIVLAYVSYNPNADLALARFNSDGSLDTGFGEAGMVITDWGGQEIPSAVVLQPDGNILVAGEVTMYGHGYSFILARYNPDGSLDTDFGYDGQVLTDIYYQEYARALALQPDGKIVLAGYSGDFVLLRYK
jgi:uncharacterized delta-60 repeat protein